MCCSQTIEYLFGDGLHHELLRRSVDLLAYLCSPGNTSLSIEQLKCVWDVACGSHHGGLSSAAAVCIAQLSPALPAELLRV